MNSDAAIEPLSADAAPLNVELSRSVGWHDTEADWRALYEAGTVLGVRAHGRLLAQGVLVDYGSAAALAKMVVAPDAQRRGLGARLLDRLLAIADQHGKPVGLCATDQGFPLYASRGFSPSGTLVILTGVAELASDAGTSEVVVIEPEAAIALDRRLTGCDRSNMLRARLREARASFALQGRSAPGFGMVTQQAPFSPLGPILAESEAGARSLFSALSRAVAGPLRIDVPLEQTSFRSWLVGLGLQERAQRFEMARGAARSPWQVRQRFALAAQAWG